MRQMIWIMLLTVGLVLTLTASAAYATCPLRANDAKAAIATAEEKGGDPAKIEGAKKLVDEGLVLHNAGKHHDSMDKIAKAIEAAFHSVTQKGAASKEQSSSY